MSQAAATTDVPPKPPELGDIRWLLVIVGAVLIVVGLTLWIKPVQHSTPAPASAKCTDAASCFVKVDDAPEILLSTLVVLGGLLLLVGVNNRPITKFTGPGGSGFETAASDADAKAKQKAATNAIARGLTDAQKHTATQIAGSEARARAYALQQATGRPLTAVEIEKVASDGARVGVDSAGGNPAFE